MRIITMPKDTEITTEVINDLIESHQIERERILNLKKYYNGENVAIANREYKQAEKPQNRLYHNFAGYITDNYVGYMLGSPVTYKSNDEQFIEIISECFDYNDEAYQNMMLCQEQSICGYAYEVLYLDELSNVRFACVDTEDMIVVYDDTLERSELFAIRYVSDKENKGVCYLYTNNNVRVFAMENNKVTQLIDEYVHYFNDVPVNTYENNRQRLGDFERVISLIDAYDQANSDTANDFEYFTDALLVVKGTVMQDEEDGLDFKNNRVLNFFDNNSDAKYLIKNINDTALENYKNRLKSDIHKFSSVVDMSDEKFAGNLSGVALEFKLRNMENVTAVKVSKFKKAIMRRIELIANIMSIKNNKNYLYTDVKPVFVRNIPTNVAETVGMVKSLYGIISNETLLSQIPFVDDVQAELKALGEQDKDGEDYDVFDLGDSDLEKDKSEEMSEVDE